MTSKACKGRPCWCILLALCCGLCFFYWIPTSWAKRFYIFIGIEDDLNAPGPFDPNHRPIPLQQSQRFGAPASKRRKRPRSQHQSLFFRLPLELRSRIYEYVFGDRIHVFTREGDKRIGRYQCTKPRRPPYGICDCLSRMSGRPTNKDGTYMAYENPRSDSKLLLICRRTCVFFIPGRFVN